jgi:hypothetical protein
MKHLLTATVSTTLDRIRTVNKPTEADRTRMRQSSRRGAGIRWLLGLTLVMTAVPVEFGLNVCQAWPTTWIEGQNNSILMAKGNDVYRSTDAGASWSLISSVSGGAGWFTRLSDNSLLLTTTAQPYGWARSVDDGVHWSSITSFGLPPDPSPPMNPTNYDYGPVIETGDGRWAHCPYYEPSGGPYFRGQYIWSGDSNHQTWSTPANFPLPTDGNRGLTESTIARIGPNNYVAAIRADEGISGAWDGFYLSYSRDGLKWTAPKPTAPGEVGRMPLFYHINDYWMLSYRQYDASTSTQYAAAQFSRDGQEWSKPYLFASGVDTNPFFVKSGSQWYLFDSQYPDRDSIIRMPVDLDALASQLLPPAPMPEPSALVLSTGALGTFGLTHRRVRACLARHPR